ncbi:hypothetical protein V1291_000234 [Nitrobacteraceae bacterium AZCC 1564]
MSRKPSLVVFAALLAISILVPGTPARAEEAPANTLHEIFEKLKHCWKSPRLPLSHAGMQVTVLVSFTRNGEILGHPRITYESPNATDDDRLQYRIAVMNTLQACTPMPFTDSLGNAVAGRPFTVRFDDRRRKPKPRERQAWLRPPKIL